LIVRALLLRAALLALVPMMVSVVATSVAAQPVPPKALGKALGKAAAKAAKSQSTQDLFKAVELNDLGAIKSSIEAGADLFAQNPDSMTAADFAVDQGYFIIAHYLLSRRIAGRTQPIALVPGKTKKVTRTATMKPKRKFASPPPKPAAERPPAAPAEAPPPQEPMRIEVGPAPVEAIGEIPPEDIAEATGETVAAVDEVQSDKPLAEQGLGSFFESLVDLITPGGEEAPQIAKEETPPEPGTDLVTIVEASPTPDDTPLPAKDSQSIVLDESVVEAVVEQSDDIIVEVTGDLQDGLVDESVEEVNADTPLTLVETDLETVTAVDEGGRSKARGKEKKEAGFLDRMASLFTTDDKPEDATASDTVATGE